MTKFFASLALAATLLLGTGCATDPNTGRPVPIPIEQLVAQAQHIAQQICAFLPTANTIIEIVNLGVPGLGTAAAIANAICAAVPPPTPQTRRKAAPVAVHGYVLGVPVRGQRV
jgi:hypothetical protein